MSSDKGILKIWFLAIIFMLGNPPTGQGGLFDEPQTAESLEVQIRELPKEVKSRKKAVLFMDLGTVYYRQGEYVKAAAAYETALQNNPRKGAKRYIYRYLGKSYENASRLDKAIEAMRTAVTYDRRNWKRRRDLGVIYESAFLYSEAVNAYQRAIRFNRKAPELYFLLGRTQRKLGLYDLAEVNLLKAQSLGEKKPELNQELSFVYEGLGRYADSVRYLRKNLTEKSSLEDWCRLIYLGALAKDKEASNDGLNMLRKQTLNSEHILFYEEFVDILTRNPNSLLLGEVVDSNLKSLVKSIRSKPLGL